MNKKSLGLKHSQAKQETTDQLYDQAAKEDSLLAIFTMIASMIFFRQNFTNISILIPEQLLPIFRNRLGFLYVTTVDEYIFCWTSSFIFIHSHIERVIILCFRNGIACWELHWFHSNLCTRDKKNHFKLSFGSENIWEMSDQECVSIQRAELDNTFI